MTPETIVYAQRLTLVEDLREFTGLRVGDDVQVLDKAGESCWLTATTVARLLWPSDGERGA